jgi:hypothetical protein
MAKKQSFSDELAGIEPHAKWDRDLAHLSSAVYQRDDEQGQLPKGWSMVPPERYPPGIVDNESLQRPGQTPLNHSSRFRASIFKYEEGERYAVVFRGTKTQSKEKSDSTGDYVESWAKNLAVNIGQATGHSTDQYDLAMMVATKANAHWGKNVVFAGHSLGGGLAGTAGLRTGNTVVTFCTAGVHPNTYLAASVDQASADRAARRGQIRAIIVDGDALDNVQKGRVPVINALTAITGQTLPTAPGNEVRLQHPYIQPDSGKGKALHSLERTISAMDTDPAGRFTDPSVRNEMLTVLARSQSPADAELRQKRHAVIDHVHNRTPSKDVEQAVERGVNAMAHDDHRIRTPGQKLADHRKAPVYSSSTNVSAPCHDDKTVKEVQLVARRKLEGKSPGSSKR